MCDSARTRISKFLINLFVLLSFRFRLPRTLPRYVVSAMDPEERGAFCSALEKTS